MGIAQQRYAASGETGHAVESSHVYIGFPDFNGGILAVSPLLNCRFNLGLKDPNGKPARSYVRFRTNMRTFVLHVRGGRRWSRSTGPVQCRLDRPDAAVFTRSELVISRASRTLSFLAKDRASSSINFEAPSPFKWAVSWKSRS